jgi:hypothetical protein
MPQIQKVGGRLANATALTSTMRIVVEDSDDGEAWLLPVAAIQTSTEGAVEGTVQIGDRTFIQEVDGDLWFTHNAYYDGANWQRVNTSTSAWGLQTQSTNNMIFENYKATTYWHAQAASNPIGGWATVGGWELVYSFSSHRNHTIGGGGTEYDGFGSVGHYGYGRYQHALVSGVTYTGILVNQFLDFSGRDDTTKPSWRAGLESNGTVDKYCIARAPGGTWAGWTELLALSAAGELTVLGSPVITEATQVDIAAQLAAALDAAADAATQVDLAEAQATMARRWAGDPVGVEIEPGLQSSYASAMLASQLISGLAGVPVTLTGAADHELDDDDKFCMIVRDNNSCTKIVLPRNLHVSPATDGRPSVCPIMVWNAGTNSLTIEGSGSAAVTPVTILQTWQGAPIHQATQPAIATTQTLNLTIPSGADRRLLIVSGDINNSTTSHTVGVTPDSGTLTQVLAVTGATGKFSTTPFVSERAWDLALTGTASLSLALEFAIPADTLSWAYRIVAVTSAAAPTVTGSSDTTAATTHARTATRPANGGIAAVFFLRNGTATGAVTGIGTVQASTSSGSLTQKDIIVCGGQEVGSSSTSVTATGTFSTSEQGASLICIWDPVSLSTSTVTLEGDTTVAQDKMAQILALSDGSTYYVSALT